jgi:hypothetical protein
MIERLTTPDELSFRIRRGLRRVIEANDKTTALVGLRLGFLLLN